MEKIDKFDIDVMACSVNPALFMEKAYGLTPDPWQEDLLLKAPRRMLLLCSRQAGKSTVCASLALHRAVYTSDALVLIISKRYRQAEETFRKVKQGLVFAKKACGGITRENQTTLQLANGSRIVSLPGQQESIRSFSSVSLLVIDEAAYVPDDLYRSVRPMLAVANGDLVALSSPFGKMGWFHNAWVNGSGWHKVEITADECPRISQEFLEEERREMGERWFMQEYYCQFVDTEDQIFGYDLVQSAFTGTLLSIDVDKGLEAVMRCM